MFKYTKETFNKIESKIGKIAALSIAVPIIFGSIYWLIGKLIFIVSGFLIIINIAELEKEVRSNMVMIANVQGVSLDGLKAEMDTKVIYGVEIQQTNGGDYWYFTEETVYIDKAGKELTIKVVYSAHIRHKEKKVGYFDFNNKHHWIDKNE